MYQPKIVTAIVNVWVMGKALGNGTGEWFLIQRFVLTHSLCTTTIKAVSKLSGLKKGEGGKKKKKKKAFCLTAFRGHASEFCCGFTGSRKGYLGSCVYEFRSALKRGFSSFI